MLPYTTVESKHPKQAKPSELDRFKLFFEFVDAPDDYSNNSSKNGRERTVRRQNNR